MDVIRDIKALEHAKQCKDVGLTSVPQSSFVAGWDACRADTKKIIETSLAQAQYAWDKCEEHRLELEKAVQYLREGKALFSPNTTNSFVDDFIAKHTRKE